MRMSPVLSKLSLTWVRIARPDITSLKVKVSETKVREVGVSSAAGNASASHATK